MCVMGEYLFVYGTLKRGHYNHHFLERAQFVDEAATFEPHWHMYSMGAFPVVVNGSRKIPGELYLCKYANTLRDVDRLEGNPFMYCREKILVETKSGLLYEAWMYVYKGATDQLHMVEEW